MSSTHLEPLTLVRTGTVRRYGSWKLRVRNQTVLCPTCGALLTHKLMGASCDRCDSAPVLAH